MTKKEHLIELNVEIDEDSLQQLEEKDVSVESVLKNYSDAAEYGWLSYSTEYPEVKTLLHLRLFFIEQVHKMDNRIDEFIENIEGDSNCQGRGKCENQ